MNTRKSDPAHGASQPRYYTWDDWRRICLWWESESALAVAWQSERALDTGWNAELRIGSGAPILCEGWGEPASGFVPPPSVLGVVMIRQGHHSVGVAVDGRLIDHGSGSHYVQGRTAAGGWSQQRFARRRAGQAKAQLDAVATRAVAIFGGRHGEIPALGGIIWGGDRTMCRELIEAIPQTRHLASRGFPELGRPGLKSLNQALWRGLRIRTSRLLPEPGDESLQ